jgi:phospholipase C
LFPDVTPGAADYAYYVRRHVGLAMYSTIMDVPHRRNRLRNFNDFAVDVSANKLPQWMFITPNILNDGHDTTIDYAGEWLDYWLVPLLADKRFNSDRTLVIVTFDEAESEFDVDLQRGTGD